jgi:hypothetical protein
MKAEQCQWSAASGWNPQPCSSTLGVSAQLVLLFGDAKLVSTEQCVAQIRQAFPKAHLFGCSTGGEIQGSRVSDGSLALTAIAFDHGRVATARARIEGVGRSSARAGYRGCPLRSPLITRAPGSQHADRRAQV